MKKVKYWLIVCMVLVMVSSWAQAFGQQGISDDRTLSPYFFVQSDNPDLDRLPLKSTRASVDISGVIADVLVTQTYQNSGKKPLEAIYVFPASTRAAVYGMRMTIGKRVIEAIIKKRDEARREYERARDAGKNASLLEQHRPNVFQMNVANIMPGDTINVELRYTELLLPTDRVYEFVYPTVVGPRYSGQKASKASPSEQWVKNPYLHEGELSSATFDISVDIQGGMPISGLVCPSHKVKASYAGTSQVKASLDKTETKAGNRDFILRYRLDGDKIQSGLLLSKGDKENFFVLMMQPPKKISNTDMPGREYIFIVDVSGSMHGFPLDISKKLLSRLIGQLRLTDKFNVLLFSGGSSLMAEESLPATPLNIQKALFLIERQRGGGGTELLPALKRALSLKKEEGYSRTLIVATDGYVSVEEEAFDLIRNHLGQANLFAFGIGSSVNRHLIEGMAHVGMGEPFVIAKPGRAEAEANRFREMIRSPILTQVKVRFSGFKVYDVEPITIPDVLVERPVLIFGKWHGRPQGTVILSGINGEGHFGDRIKVDDSEISQKNSALKYLWARHRITLLSDYNRLRQDDKRVKEITDLGLKYNLLTAYTSFVAVDSEVRNVEGKQTTIKQPLPLPEGVSDNAVGGRGRLAAAPTLLKSRAMASPKEENMGRLTADRSEAQEVEAPEKKDKREWVPNIEVSSGKGLTKEAILQVVELQVKALINCLPNREFSEKIKIRLTIGPDGKVKKVRILFDHRQAEKLEKCLVQQIKGWKFPETENGVPLTVTVILKG